MEDRDRGCSLFLQKVIFKSPRLWALRSFLTPRSCGSVTRGDLRSETPAWWWGACRHVTRQGAAAPRGRRLHLVRSWFQSGFPAPRPLTAGLRPPLARVGPGGMLVTANRLVGFALLLHSCIQRCGCRFLKGLGTAVLFLPPSSSEKGDSPGLGDYHKHWPCSGHTFVSDFTQLPRLSCASPLGEDRIWPLV